MKLPTKICTGAVIAAGWASMLVLGPLGSAAAHRPGGPTPLIERPGCRPVGEDRARATHTAASGAAGVAGATTVTQDVRLSVPRTALLRVDPGGRVVAVATNTGCAPRPGDQLFYVRTDGTIAAAPTSVLAHRHWTGDFTTPGVYVTQPAAHHHD